MNDTIREFKNQNDAQDYADNQKEHKRVSTMTYYSLFEVWRIGL